MNDDISSILPVSASRAERVVDCVAGDMLSDIAVFLIRYVKIPIYVLLNCCHGWPGKWRWTPGMNTGRRRKKGLR